MSPFVKRSGGGKTCSCFFDATTGRRIDMRKATPISPLGRGSLSLQPAVAFPSDFRPHSRVKDDESKSPEELDDTNIDSWVCSECEEKNSLEETSCSMCDAKRPSTTMWTCLECDEDNPMEVESCEMCDTWAPKVVK